MTFQVRQVRAEQQELLALEAGMEFVVTPAGMGLEDCREQQVRQEQQVDKDLLDLPEILDLLVT